MKSFIGHRRVKIFEDGFVIMYNNLKGCREGNRKFKNQEMAIKYYEEKNWYKTKKMKK